MRSEKKYSPRPAMILALALLFLAGCAGGAGKAADPGSPKAGQPITPGPRLSLELSPGEYYKTTTNWFIFRIPIYPQVAAWVESPEGRYLGTLYVTGKADKASWIGAPRTGRPEALPVWSHLRQGGMDGISSATSAGETRKDSSLAAALPPGDYVVKLETNRSYDYNAAYPREKAGVCGQPSLVYEASLRIGSGPARARFKVLGTGSLDGSDGDLRTGEAGLAGIDTALLLFSRMEISYAE